MDSGRDGGYIPPPMPVLRFIEPCYRHLPTDRRPARTEFMRSSTTAIALWRGDGHVVFQHACKLGLEGIVSKRLGSRYRSGRSSRLAQVQEPARASGQARGGRGLGKMMNEEDCLGARFEILLDGKTQYCRDTLVIAMGAANIIQGQNPNSRVAVRDLQTGQLTVIPKPATQTQ